MPIYSSFSDWIIAPVTTKVYLVTLTLHYVSGGAVLTEKLYLSNYPYNTGSSDDPANTEFVAVLQDQDIPSFLQELSGTLFGLGIPSFGELRIANTDGEFDGKLPPTREWEGGEAMIELTGTKAELAYANRKSIQKGVIGKILEYSDTLIRVEIFNRLQNLNRKMFPTTTFTAPNGELTPSPVLYGHGQNIRPPLKTAGAGGGVYKIAGHALTDITAVYDNAVALTVTTQWTKDLVNGEFTLLVNPTGTITCDAKGKATKYPGDYSEQRFDFVFDAIESYGGISSNDIDAASFSQGNVDVSGSSWIYVKEEVSVLDFAVSLLHPVIGYLFADRNGKFFAGVIKSATGTPELTLTDANLIPLSGGISLGEEDNIEESGDKNITSTALAEVLYSRVRLLYDRNGAVQSEGEIGATGAVDPTTVAGQQRRAWLAEGWRSTEKELTGATQGRNLYPNAGELKVESHFRNKADADNFAQDWLDKFGVSRRIITCRASLQPLQTELHDVVRINRARFFTNVDTRVIRYRENYAENVVEMGLLVI